MMNRGIACGLWSLCRAPRERSKGTITSLPYYAAPSDRLPKCLLAPKSGKNKHPENARKHLIYKVERVMGIEPTFEAWEAPVLPLNYTREVRGFHHSTVEGFVESPPDTMRNGSGNRMTPGIDDDRHCRDCTGHIS